MLLHQSRAANKRLERVRGRTSISLTAFARPQKMYNLRADLFERGTETQFCSDRLAYGIFPTVPSQAIATKRLERFKKFRAALVPRVSGLIRSWN